MTKPKNLAEAICQVMADAGYVQKTGKNSFHGYNYASDADLLRVLQPAMAKAGLCMMATNISSIDKELDKGKTQTDVLVTYTLRHASGESIEIHAIGRGIDKEDKGGYKAMTGALKYALRQTFLIPTGDDPEVHEDDAASPAPKKAAPKKAPAPKKTAPKKVPSPKKASASPAASGAPKSVAGSDDPACPKCGGPMWDDSEKRRKGGKAPAYKCKAGTYDSKTRTTKGCDGVIWDPIGGSRKNGTLRGALKSADPFPDEEIPF